MKKERESIVKKWKKKREKKKKGIGWERKINKERKREKDCKRKGKVLLIARESAEGIKEHRKRKRIGKRKERENK